MTVTMYVYNPNCILLILAVMSMFIPYYGLFLCEIHYYTGKHSLNGD